MRFYATETPDGLIHVQNFVGPLRGQHHVHTKESFERWQRETGSSVEVLKKGECYCGLKAGDVREHDGFTWHNDKFDDKSEK
jgi:hypothetical protein